MKSIEAMIEKVESRRKKVEQAEFLKHTNTIIAQRKSKEDAILKKIDDEKKANEQHSKEILELN